MPMSSFHVWLRKGAREDSLEGMPEVEKRISWSLRKAIGVSDPLLVVSLTGVPPVALMEKISIEPSRLLEKMIFEPSGLHIGAVS